MNFLGDWAAILQGFVNIVIPILLTNSINNNLSHILPGFFQIIRFYFFPEIRSEM